MAEDIAGLAAALSARMRELGAGPNDPRMAPLLAQMQALMRQHVAAATLPAAIVPEAEYTFDLPARSTRRPGRLPACLSRNLPHAGVCASACVVRVGCGTPHS